MWSVEIIEPQSDGKHLFEAKNLTSGELIRGRIGSFPPSFQLLPRSFFDAVNEQIDRFNQASLKIEPQSIISIDGDANVEMNDVINDDINLRWDDVTEDVTETTKTKNTARWRPYLGWNMQYND